MLTVVSGMGHCWIDPGLAFGFVPGSVNVDFVCSKVRVAFSFPSLDTLFCLGNEHGIVILDLVSSCTFNLAW
jgi:hypothetical protein